MKKINFYLLSVFFTWFFGVASKPLSAQEFDPKLFKIAPDALKKDGYKAALDSLSKNEAAFQSSPSTKHFFYQTLSVHYSLVSNDREASAAFDRVMGTGYPSQINADSLFQGVTATPAVDYILKKTASERVVMINEAHYQTRHRVLTLSLLEGLYGQGFRYLALEALFEPDSALAQRKYPLPMTTGYYISEPAFGNLVREAIKMGFKIAGYEAKQHCDYDAKSLPGI